MKLWINKFFLIILVGNKQNKIITELAEKCFKNTRRLGKFKINLESKLNSI